MEDHKALAASLQHRSPKEQRDFLKKSVSCLMRQQIRDLKTIVNEYHFGFDILGKLPLEISIEIVRYLELYQIFQARRVSHRWAEILTSSALLKASLEPWPQSGIELFPDNADRAQSFSITAERIDAWQRGNPFSIAIKDVDPNDIQCWCCNDGIFAWVRNNDPVTINLCHLKDDNDNTVTVPGEDEDMFVAIGMSSSLIAGVTVTGKVYVWKIPLEPQRSPRLIKLESAISGHAIRPRTRKVPSLEFLSLQLACYRDGLIPPSRSTCETTSENSEHEDIVHSWTRTYTVENGSAESEEDVINNLGVKMGAFISGQAFYFLSGESSGPLLVVNLETGEYCPAASDLQMVAAACHGDIDRFGESPFAGDGRFLVTGLADKLWIMSFDKTIDLPNETSEWKVARRRMFEEHVKMRREEQRRVSETAA